MTPSARIADLIKLLDIVLNSRIPMDITAGDWFRGRKYVGSKDRRDIAERLYRIMRHKARYLWHINKYQCEENARNYVVLDCFFHDEHFEKRFFSGGGQYAAETLSNQEKEWLANLDILEPNDMPLETKLEIPQWAEDKIKNLFGHDLEQEMHAMLKEATLDLRVNTLLCTKQEAQQSLNKDGIETQNCDYSPIGLRLKEKTYLSKTKAFSKGMIEIQDEGSQLISLLTEAKPGMRVLDYCAGGGGKTLTLAAMMENKGSIVASDIDTRRLENGRKRYRKAGVHNVELKSLADEKTRKWFRRQKETFDIVLVDAPCSSSGTWRRNPDLRWRFYGPSLDQIKELQAEILERVAKSVKIGGRLVYATCSLFEEENEDQIHIFLKNHPEFQILPIHQACDIGLKPQIEDNFMRLTPHKNKTDGFFTAILIRK